MTFNQTEVRDSLTALKRVAEIPLKPYESKKFCLKDDSLKLVIKSGCEEYIEEMMFKIPESVYLKKLATKTHAALMQTTPKEILKILGDYQFIIRELHKAFSMAKVSEIDLAELKVHAERCKVQAGQALAAVWNGHSKLNH